MDRPQACSLGLLWLCDPGQVTSFLQLSVPVSKHCDRAHAPGRESLGHVATAPSGTSREEVVLVEIYMCFY